MVAGEVRPWRYPPRFDLQYGEWLRADALAGRLEAPPASPDVAILLTMARSASGPLIGPPARALLDSVPQHDIARAILEEIQPLLGDLQTDTRNVLLTLARMWSTVATGEIRSKADAADWALERLPEKHRPVLEAARAAYLGEADDGSYDRAAVRSHAAVVATEIRHDGSSAARD